MIWAKITNVELSHLLTPELIYMVKEMLRPHVVVVNPDILKGRSTAKLFLLQGETLSK